jgi:hypothetical protein
MLQRIRVVTTTIKVYLNTNNNCLLVLKKMFYNTFNLKLLIFLKLILYKISKLMINWHMQDHPFQT